MKNLIKKILRESTGEFNWAEEQVEFTDSIFQYLDNKGYKVMEKKGFIFFLNPTENLSIITYSEIHKICIMFHTLVEEISNRFLLLEGDAKEIIGKWVENTLQVEVIKTRITSMNLINV